jgi:VanZ family protein
MAAAIVWQSLTARPLAIDLESGDKLGHFAGYGVLMFWFAQLYLRRLAWAAGFIALGIALEFMQGWLGYRSFELYDMLANALGVLLGWAGALLRRKPLFR